MTTYNHMSATQAYESAARTIGTYSAELQKAKTNQLRKLADQMRILADAFDKHPETWTRGTYADHLDHQVCSVGMLQAGYRKKAGLRNLDVPIVSRPALRDVLIGLNDSITWTSEGYRYVGPKNLVRVYRILAKRIDQFAAEREAGRVFTIGETEEFVAQPLKTAARKAGWYANRKVAA